MMKMGEKKGEKTKSLLQLTEFTCRWLNEYLKKNVSGGILGDLDMANLVLLPRLVFCIVAKSYNH